MFGNANSEVFQNGRHAMSVDQNSKLRRRRVSLTLSLVLALPSLAGCNFLSNSDRGRDDRVTEIVKAHSIALANSDAPGVCGNLSDWAKGDFASFANEVIGIFEEAEAGGMDIDQLPVDPKDIPTDPVDYCRFDVETSRDLLKENDGGPSWWREALRHAQFGKPRIAAGGESPRVSVGIVGEQGQDFELAYGLLKEGGTWTVDYIDYRDPGNSGGRFFPTDVETATMMWTGNGYGD